MFSGAQGIRLWPYGGQAVCRVGYVGFTRAPSVLAVDRHLYHCCSVALARNESSPEEEALRGFALRQIMQRGFSKEVTMTFPFEAAKPVRIQIDFAEDRVRDMDSLMERCGITTRKDLFNNALSILEWAIEEQEAAKVVASVDRDGERYVILRMPALDFAAKRAAAARVAASKASSSSSQTGGASVTELKRPSEVA